MSMKEAYTYFFIIAVVFMFFGYAVSTKFLTHCGSKQIDYSNSYQEYMEYRHRVSVGECTLIGASSKNGLYGFSCDEKKFYWVRFPKQEQQDKPIKKKGGDSNE